MSSGNDLTPASAHRDVAPSSAIKLHTDTSPARDAQTDFEPGSRSPPSAGAVYIVQGDLAVADALKHSLREAACAVRIFSRAVEFLDDASLLPPGCVITAMRLPGMSGLELIREIRDRRLPFEGILVSDEGDVRTAVAAIQAGATDVIEKPVFPGALLEAVENAQRRLRQRTGEAWALASFRQALARLTPRERDVLSGVVSGRSNKEIARELGISPRTVELHRANLRIKTQTRATADLVRLAVNPQANTYAAA
ncbi:MULTISPECIES: response regulator transcription factor [unclassified Phenylobacterium]|uniref:response regulator transcription factor n=1 Tax=unclassified Phenylobacterium TaxID=2640670 RepID=UPI0018D1FAA1|nr:MULTISPECIES: response regulator [unclassified Phenylobacterium]